MTLFSGHKIRNSSPGGLRSSTLPLGHGGSPEFWIFQSERRGNILSLWNLKAIVGFEHLHLRLSKQAVSTTDLTATTPPRNERVDLFTIKILNQTTEAGACSRNSPLVVNEMKWNKSSFRPPLCTYRLNWARKTSWGWWDDWDDTVIQTQDSKFEPLRSEAEYATSRSRRLPTILTFTRGWGRKIFGFFQTAETGNRTPNSGVKGSGANHYPRAPPCSEWRWFEVGDKFNNTCIVK